MLVGQEIPLLALKNSHGGQTALEFLESLFRKVCSNGLMLPKHDNKFAKVYHKVGMEEEVIHAAFRVIKEFPERIRNVSEMKTIDLNHDEKKVLAECAVRLAFQKSPELVELNKAQRNDISDLILRPKRFEDRQNDLWTTFNVIQENIIKGGERIYSQNEKGQLNYSKMRPVREIDRNTTLNQELMALALEMKKLKQVGGA
jgi:hypothetical protein